MFILPSLSKITSESLSKRMASAVDVFNKTIVKLQQTSAKALEQKRKTDIEVAKLQLESKSLEILSDSSLNMAKKISSFIKGEEPKDEVQDLH